jgi:tetratricopeptide (TPR) repeat protein
MASKKKSLASKNPNRGFGVKSLNDGLRQAKALIVRQKWAEAQAILQELSKTYPRRDVLTYLAETCYELGDMAGYGYACDRLLEINPNDSDTAFALAGAYLSNLHPILALQTFRQAIARWPDAEPAAEARKLVVELEANVDKLLEEMNLTGEGGMEIAILHERGQAYLAQHEYQKAREAEEELLRQRPDFVSARNNLSLISFAEGDLEGAIAICQQVLESQPDNIHALSNLTRFYCLQGEREKARAVAEKLKTSQAVLAWDV